MQGLIQAGFPRARAEAALRAVGNENCCQPQMKWLFEQSRATNAERPKPKSGQCNKQENTDYDGFAVRWGSANIQQSWEDCCKSCHDYVPNPPDFYPCNIWVFCAHEECFAPAAGEFKRGQCWLKYQEDPTNPHVNMRGKYSDDYRRTHPTVRESHERTAPRGERQTSSPTPRHAVANDSCARPIIRPTRSHSVPRDQTQSTKRPLVDSQASSHAATCDFTSDCAELLRSHTPRRLRWWRGPQGPWWRRARGWATARGPAGATGS